MINLDQIISEMKANSCNTCSLMKATYDDTKEQEWIYGSFCDFSNGYPTIQITAKSIARVI